MANARLLNAGIVRGWNVEIALDFHQWMMGFNAHPMPWPCWNIFLGPLRIGGYRGR